MSRKQKLELTWVGKEDRPKLKPASCWRIKSAPTMPRCAYPRVTSSITA